ncbi:hypothetical protein GW17_00003946 [Ensete ventricosum]|nr:hypothetical protein GW17_00003946 [Ensete ventricosum]
MFWNGPGCMRYTGGCGHRVTVRTSRHDASTWTSHLGLTVIVRLVSPPRCASRARPPEAINGERRRWGWGTVHRRNKVRRRKEEVEMCGGAIISDFVTAVEDLDLTPGGDPLPRHDRGRRGRAEAAEDVVQGDTAAALGEVGRGDKRPEEGVEGVAGDVRDGGGGGPGVRRGGARDPGEQGQAQLPEPQRLRRSRSRCRGGSRTGRRRGGTPHEAASRCLGGGGELGVVLGVAGGGAAGADLELGGAPRVGARGVIGGCGASGGRKRDEQRRSVR